MRSAVGAEGDHARQSKRQRAATRPVATESTHSEHRGAASDAAANEPPSRRTRSGATQIVPTVRLVMRSSCPSSCPTSCPSAAVGSAPGGSAQSAPRRSAGTRRQATDGPAIRRASTRRTAAPPARPASAARADEDALSDGGQDVDEVRRSLTCQPLRPSHVVEGLARLLHLQVQSVSDYTHPSPAASIHRRDDDDDDDSDDDGLAREEQAVGARADLGIREDGAESEADDNDRAQDSSGAGADGGRGGSNAGVGGGGGGQAGAAGKRPKSLTVTTLPVERFPQQTGFVVVSLRSTGGKSPRIISIASQVTEYLKRSWLRVSPLPSPSPSSSASLSASASASPHPHPQPRPHRRPTHLRLDPNYWLRR